MKIEKKTENKKKWVNPTITEIDIKNSTESSSDGVGLSSLAG